MNENEISDEAWVHTASKEIRDHIETDAFGLDNYISSDIEGLWVNSFYVSRERALAAQAELDAQSKHKKGISDQARDSARKVAAKMFHVPLGKTLHSDDLADAVVCAALDAQAELDAQSTVSDAEIMAATQAWIDAKSELQPPSFFTVLAMLQAAYKAKRAESEAS